MPVLLHLYLDQFLIFVLVLTRIGSLLMSLPMLGTATIPWQIRGLLAVGIVTRSRGARLAALALVAVTGCKSFLYDLSRLGGLYRVASFVGLAVALSLVALALQKYVLAGSREKA